MRYFYVCLVFLFSSVTTVYAQEQDVLPEQCDSGFEMKSEYKKFLETAKDIILAGECERKFRTKANTVSEFKHIISIKKKLVNSDKVEELEILEKEADSLSEKYLKNSIEYSEQRLKLQMILKEIMKKDSEKDGKEMTPADISI